MKFPKILYVRIDNGHNKGDEWLIAEATQMEAIADDGPTEVAAYALVGSSVLAKQAVYVKKSKKKWKP